MAPLKRKIGTWPSPKLSLAWCPWWTIPMSTNVGRFRIAHIQRWFGGAQLYCPYSSLRRCRMGWGPVAMVPWVPIHLALKVSTVFPMGIRFLNLQQDNPNWIILPVEVIHGTGWAYFSCSWPGWAFLVWMAELASEALCRCWQRGTGQESPTCRPLSSPTFPQH